jgi:hypothetical protein
MKMPIPTWPRVQNHLNAMQWDLINNPEYSLDSSPFDFHIFGPLKIALKGCTLAQKDNVHGVVCKYSGLGSSQRNSLQMGYATLCITRTSV